MLLLAVPGPLDVLAGDVDLHVLRHVVDLGIERVGRIAGGVEPGTLSQEREHLGEAVVGAHHSHQIGREAVAQVEGGERQRPTRVLLLGQAVQVGAVADLGLDLLLAVAEVVVGQDGDHHSPGVARGDLEGPAVVVPLALVRPAHPGGTLRVRGAALVRQAELLLAEPREVGREDHAAAVARPAVHVEPGVVGRQGRIAGIAEDALHEVQVGHQPAGREEAHLHPLLRRDPGNLGAHQRPQHQRDHGLHGLRPVRREGQARELGRRAERLLEQPQERPERHAGLVRGDREPALRDVEYAPGGAPVVGRIVEYAVVQAVARDQLVAPRLRVDRQGQLARESVAVENERLRGEPHGLGKFGGLEQPVEVILDPPVGRAQVFGEQPRLLAIAGEEIARQVEHVLVARLGRDLSPHRRELEQDGADGGAALREPRRAVGPESYCSLELHDIPPGTSRYESPTERTTDALIRQPPLVLVIPAPESSGWTACRSGGSMSGGIAAMSPSHVVSRTD